MLSGGMDSAIVASYLRGGGDAYTFRFLNGEYQKDELNRAEYYAKYYGLKLHYVDITWDTVVKHLDAVMQAKSAPVQFHRATDFASGIASKKRRSRDYVRR